MDVNRIIELLVIFFAAYLVWMTLRWLVLPHLKIFPYIPPEALWVNAYNVLAAAATAVFWMSLAFIIALWAVWKAVRKFLPYTILGIPVGKAILRSSPLREFSDAGIIPLVNDIYNVLKALLPFKPTLRGIWEAFQKFYRTSLTFIITRIRKDYGIDEAIRRERNRKRNPPVYDFTDVAPAEAPDAPEEAAASADEAYMRQEVEDAYQQCLEENSVSVDPDASAADRLRAAIKNSSVRAACGARKMQTYAQLMAYRER